MAELRKNPLTGNWVIISCKRGKRPLSFFLEEKRNENEEKCPFCEGNEGTTPPEVFSYRQEKTAPDTPGWWIRVVPNKFPALSSKGQLNRQKKGIYERMNGVGAHEVIIETPHHVKDLFSFEPKEIEKIIWIYRRRLIALMKDPRFEYVLIFKNKGQKAGASFSHSHSQVIATPLIPKDIKEKLQSSKKYFDSEKKCIFCEIISEEINLKKRVLWDDENLLSFCPFASRFPYEMCILPKAHCSDFRKIDESIVKSLAIMLKKCINALNKILPGISYNYIIQTSPFSKSNLKYYHWHIEIIPRFTRIAGFEWGTGIYINHVPPEDAAKHLKKGIKRTKK